MKMRAVVVAVAAFMSLAPFVVLAAEHDHGSMNMDHGAMAAGRGGGMMHAGKLIHEEVVDGVKATFFFIDIRKKMKELGMKETHHIMVTFTDPGTGKKFSRGEARIKVVDPDKSEQVKELMGMEGGFGADFVLAKPGKYAVMTKFKLDDGKVRTVKFWYTVK